MDQPDGGGSEGEESVPPRRPSCAAGRHRRRRAEDRHRRHPHPRGCPYHQVLEGERRQGHLGQPPDCSSAKGLATKGRQKGVTPKYSLKHLVPRLSELLELDVVTANECTDDELQQLAATLPDGGVLLLENAGLYEEEDDPDFAQKVASVADVYVNDAFAHGSQLEGKTLQGAFAFDISDGIHTATVIKNGLPDKTSHISDDGVSSKLPIGKGWRTIPSGEGAFTYEITGDGESRMEDKKVIHHISTDGGRSDVKVKEGRGLPGVFDWSDNNSVVAGESGMEEDKVIHHISSDAGATRRSKVKEGKGLPGVFDWSDNNSVIVGESGQEDTVIHHTG